jgi:2-furoate---CoA ligase
MLDNARALIAAAERAPGAEALVDGGERLTYAELLDRAAAVAAGLGALGIGKGERVLTVLQNTWQAAVLHWACQLAGIVITPVNWRANAEEIDYFLGNSGARAVIYQDVSAGAVAAAKTAGALPRIAVGVAGSADPDFASLMAAPGMLLDAVAISPDDISVMLYTSGTTGAGKGVPRSHSAERVAAVAHVAQNLYAPGERSLGVMPLYHTMGVRLLLSMAAVGGCFVCQARFDPAEALKLIAREKITCLYLVPTLYHDLIHRPEFAGADISKVRKLGFAGAAMTDGLLKRLDEAFRPDLFVNHYGSSEIYTFTICDDAVAKPGSAGKAGINQRIRVVMLDSTDPNALAAVGEEGQIIAAMESSEAFRGYWNRPDADAKALHDGWYFTGDVGYMDADGDLFVTGRVDDMIISGGENVLPAEIESLLSMHPDVSEVVVVGLPDERWGQKVTAFVKATGDVSAEALDSYCRQSDLANFKRPRGYVFIDEIPKSPVGKILRRKLRETYAGQ